MSDDRFAQRRQVVAEDRARRSLKRTAQVLVVAALAASVVYVANSPLLSVQSIDVVGVGLSRAIETLAEHDISIGEPMFTLNVSEAEAAIAGNPWVIDVSVDRRWPTTIDVVVTERSALAVVGTSRDVVAIDGVVLPGDGSGLPLILLPAVSTDGVYTSADVVGSLQFIEALRPDLVVITRIVADVDGLIAEVGEYRVRLGRPVDMAEKARALGPVIDRQPAPGSEITLIAPGRPAVLSPGDDPASDDDG